MEKCHVIFGQNLKFWLQCCWDTVVEKPQQCTVLSSCSSHLSGQLNWANTGESTVKPSLLSAQPHYALGLHSVLQADFFFSVISAPLWFDTKNLEFHKYQNYMTDEDWVRFIRFWKSKEGIQISEAEKYINPPPLDIWWQRLSVFATKILQYRLAGP